METKEKELVNEKIIEDKNYYNISLGGQGGITVLYKEHPLYKKTCKKIKEIQQENQELEVVIEEIQEQSNMQTFKKLAMVQGVLLAELHRRGVRYHLVYAASWKSGCGIAGRTRAEQKRSAQAHIKNQWGFEVTQDEADAICLGEYIATKIKNWGR